MITVNTVDNQYWTQPMVQLTFWC